MVKAEASACVERYKIVRTDSACRARMVNQHNSQRKMKENGEEGGITIRRRKCRHNVPK